MASGSKYTIFATGLTVLSIAGCSSGRGSGVSYTNIVYVFLDQYRNHALGFWSQEEFGDRENFRGDPVVTPNIDAFARRSVALTSAQSNCQLSSPHHGMLLTGMYSLRSGVPLNCNSNRPLSSLNREAECTGDVFAVAGYDCGYFGKLHADSPTPNDHELPGHYVEEQRPVWSAYTPRHGFNYWYSYGTYNVHKAPHYWDTEGRKHQIGEWSPIHEAQEVVSYIKIEREQRDSSKPFFVMVAMNPPHSPYMSPDDCMEENWLHYRDKSPEKLLVRRNVDLSMAKTACAPFYFASVTGVDRAFGIILDALRSEGPDGNTIVVFTSDHGETMRSQATHDPYQMNPMDPELHPQLFAELCRKTVEILRDTEDPWYEQNILPELMCY